MEKNSKVRIPKQKRSILRKEALREKALSLFCSKGFQQTTTNQIAEEAGMSIGSLYEYYANKEEILYDIVDQCDLFMSRFEVPRMTGISTKEK